MPEGFTLFEKDKVKPGNSKGRPQSAGTTSKGKGGKVNNVHGAIAKEGTKNRGRAAAMKAYYGDAGEPVGDNLALMSKEGLMLEINELKKKNKLLEKQSGQVKAENQRLDDEVKKQQQRIERLMDPAAAARSGVSASGTRKEVEKSLLASYPLPYVYTIFYIEMIYTYMFRFRPYNT